MVPPAHADPSALSTADSASPTPDFAIQNPKSKIQNPKSAIGKFDTRLGFLLAMRGQPEPPEFIADILKNETAAVTLVLREAASPALVDRLSSRGVVPYTPLGRFLPARVPWGSLASVAAMPEVESIESAFHPFIRPPLDLSIPDIGADAAWNMSDYDGFNLTGKGVVIADLDTGVDVLHPVFFRPDGGTYRWLDANSNGLFDAGTDAVDLNGDGSAQANETLGLLQSSVPSVNSPGYDTDIDWLYNDANRNGARDFGAGAGFNDSSPSFGETLFLANDTDRDRRLSVNETLTGLKTSKVLATNATGPVERLRGRDMILTAPDPWSHGTPVSGILVGGAPRLHRFTGVAPDADLVVADAFTNGFEASLPWALEKGVRAVLFEVGGWVGEFMDGTSALELMMDDASARGVVMVNPSGNLAASNKHAIAYIGPGSKDLTFAVPGGARAVWLSLLWRNESNNLSFTLTGPAGGAPFTVPGDGSTVTYDGHSVYTNRSVSERGTVKTDIFIWRTTVRNGNWRIGVTNGNISIEELDGFVADDISGWGGGTTFTTFATPKRTATWPSNADSAITLGSHGTRANWFGTQPGELSGFSGRGPRIDGNRTVDLTAPGDYDVIAPGSLNVVQNGGYISFGGTSASGPHVAGTVALMLQANPALGPEHLRSILRETARNDAFTGPVPNDDWGHGKLNASKASARALSSYVDLSLRNLTVSMNAVEDEPLEFAVEVVNRGRAPAGSVNLSLVLNGQALLNCTAAVPASGAARCTFRWERPVRGTHSVGVVADPGGSVEELDEGNNTLNGSVAVNGRPVARLAADRGTVLTFEAVNFTANLSHDDGPALMYRYDFGDGNSGGWMAADGAAHAYARAGVYNATLIVKDGFGVESLPAKAPVTVLNRPPAASGTVNRSGVQTFEDVRFDGTASADREGNITLYWNFGDGNGSAGAVARHNYTRSGLYTASLTVTDSDGAAETSYFYIAVKNRPPAADFSVDGPVHDSGGWSVTFTASARDPDGSVAAYRWFFGDGETGYGPVVDHTYPFSREGTVAVVLVVEDDESAAGAPATKMVTLDDWKPVAGFTVSGNRTANAIITFTSVSHDPEAGPLRYQWIFGDDTTGGGREVYHIYRYSGVYNVTLLVSDRTWQTDTVSNTITIVNAPPAAVIETDSLTVIAGQSVLLDGRWSMDSDGWIVGYEWRVNGTYIGNGSRQNHTFSRPGIYNVTVRVVDNGGLGGEAEVTLTVVEQSPATSPQPRTVVDESGWMAARGLGAALGVALLLLALFIYRNRKADERGGSGKGEE